MSRRGRWPDVHDWHLWTEVKRTVRPLRPRELAEEIAEAPLPLPSVTPPKPVVPNAPTFPSYQAPPQRKVRGDAEPRLEPKMRRKVRRGHIEIDATIDLHGMRQTEARAALGRFVNAHYEMGDRTLLVITGKGLKKLDDEGTQIVERGVLRSMLPIWLSEPSLAPLIAGWDSSAQQHGGEGAFYVRLKRYVR